MSPTDEQIVEQPVVAAPDANEGVEVDLTPAANTEAPVVAEPEKPVAAKSDDELAGYSQNVKKRISELTYKYHEAERQRQAAESIAAQAVQQAEYLRNQVNATSKVLGETATRKAESELEFAKKKFAEATTLGDNNAAAEAAAEMARIQNERLNAQRFAAAQPAQAAPVQQQPQQPAQPVLSEKARAWHEKNPWFKRDAALSAVAMAKHQEIALMNPEWIQADSDDYYKAIDKEVRKRFPERFEQEVVENPAPVAQKVKSPVAASTRNGVNSNGKVRLSESQVKVIDRLRGQYSREEFMKRYAQYQQEMA